MRREMKNGLVVCLLAVLCGIFAGVKEQAQRTFDSLPEGMLLYNDEGVGIQWEERVSGNMTGEVAEQEYERNREKMDVAECVDFVTDIHCADEIYRNAYVTAVSELYDKINKIKLQEGKWFAEKSVRQMIVSERAAGRGGFTVGEKVQIQGVDYRIVGVAASTDLKEKDAADGYYGDFIVNIPPEKEMKVTRIFVKYKSGKILHAREKIDELNQIYGKTLDGELYSVDEVRKLGRNFWEFWAGIGIFPVVFYGLYLSEKEAYKAYKSKRNFHILILFMKAATLCAGSYRLIYWILGSTSAPRIFLPEEQMFDVQFYYKLIKEYFQGGLLDEIDFIKIVNRTLLYISGCYMGIVFVFWGIVCAYKSFGKRRSVRE